MSVLFDHLYKYLFELHRDAQQLYIDLDTLGDDYNSTQEQFRAVIAQFEADRKKVVDRIMDSRFKMRDLSTPEAWEELTDIRKRKGLYKQTIRQPGQ